MTWWQVSIAAGGVAVLVECVRSHLGARRYLRELKKREAALYTADPDAAIAYLEHAGVVPRLPLPGGVRTVARPVCGDAALSAAMADVGEERATRRALALGDMRWLTDVKRRR